MQNWENNKSFSTKLPRFQTSIDSTSLGAFKQCPRYYYYSIICGYTKVGVQIHLDFGSAAHHVCENYQRARSRGIEPRESPRRYSRRSPSRNMGLQSQRSSLRRPPKEPHIPNPLRRRIPRPLRERRIPNHLQLANGKPAVELTFLFDSGLRSSLAEPIMLCGHLDRLVSSMTQST